MGFSKIYKELTEYSTHSCWVKIDLFLVEINFFLTHSLSKNILIRKIQDRTNCQCSNTHLTQNIS